MFGLYDYTGARGNQYLNAVDGWLTKGTVMCDQRDGLGYRDGNPYWLFGEA